MALELQNGFREEIRLTSGLTAYWIAFGPHGPRAQAPPGENTKVFLYTIIGVLAAGGVFGFTRYFARGTPHTMNKEWQEATNEYLRVSISGIRQRNGHISIRPCAGVSFSARAILLTLISQDNKIEPITFVGNPDYKGPGAVQSPPKPKE